MECDSSVADILSGRPERVSAKKGPPPSHCGLKFWLVTTLRATRSLRSLKQALRLTPPAGISPFGHRPPFQWAGSCTSACVFVVRRCGGRHIAKCFCSLRADSNAARAREVCWCGPTSFENLHRMPVEDLCRRFASPLFVMVVRRQCGGGRVLSFLLILLEFLCRTLSRAALVLWFHLMKKRTHIRRESFPSYVGPHFLLEQHQQRGAAVRRDTKPRGNTGTRLARARRSSPGSSCGPLLYLMRPSSHPLPGQAPG